MVIISIVHVDDIFAVGDEARCDEFGKVSQHDGSSKESWGVAMVFWTRVRDRFGEGDANHITTFAEELAQEYGVT